MLLFVWRLDENCSFGFKNWEDRKTVIDKREIFVLCVSVSVCVCVCVHRQSCICAYMGVYACVCGCLCLSVYKLVYL